MQSGQELLSIWAGIIINLVIMGEKCNYCSYIELCEKTEEDVTLCNTVLKTINIAADLTKVEYDDIVNVKEYVDKILKFDIEKLDVIVDHTGMLICPACNDIIFLRSSNSDSYTCITCYRKYYVNGYGWYDLEYYDIIQDMIEREKVRRLLQKSGRANAFRKLFKIHKKRNKNKNYSNFGEVLLNMDEVAIRNMNELLYKLNQEDILYDTKEDAIAYISRESERYNFVLVLENDNKDEYNKDEYCMYITWKDNRILDGFIDFDDDNKWWISFRYFYI